MGWDADQPLATWICMHRHRICQERRDNFQRPARYGRGRRERPGGAMGAKELFAVRGPMEGGDGCVQVDCM